MGSQSSQHRLGSFSKRLEYDELIKYDGQQGYLQIHGMIIQQNKVITIVHHGFCFDIPQNEYYLFFQWGRSGHDIYKSKAKQQHFHKSLGKIDFKSFKEAWVSVTFNQKYHALNFNCNHFTQNIIKKIGFNQSIKYDCNCVQSQRLQQEKNK